MTSRTRALADAELRGQTVGILDVDCDDVEQVDDLRQQATPAGVRER